MSDTVIRVENLSKKYVLGHQRDGSSSYKSLRESMSDGAKLLGKRLLKPSGKGTIKTDQEEFWALKDVSFEIKQGDKIGIIGRNGAGKSTLLKILSRITEPTSGSIRIKGRVASLLEVGTGFHPELTGRENIYLNGAILGMSKLEIQRKFDEIVAFAEVEKFLDTPVKRYSSGMYVRLAFAVAAHLEPEILIIDEVLAVGDISFQDKCLGKMEDVSSTGKTVIFVSHSMDSIRRLCSSGIFLCLGRVQAIGSMESVVEQYLGQFRADEQNSVIYFNNKNKEKYYVERIEILEIDGSIKKELHTWDSVRFRIVFHSPGSLKAGSVILQIATLSGTVISLYSTYPDSNYQINFKEGINHVDCILPQILLSSGKYLIGAGLAIPNAEWLYRELEHSILNILPRDVFKSGLAPVNTRYLIPQEHVWETPKHQFLSPT